MMILGPWVSYLVADGLELSGIVAILTNGLFLNMYAAPNISKGSRKVLMICYETIAYSAETLVFIFLGIGVFAFDHPMDQIGIGSLILCIINFNVARFLNIQVVTYLVNKSRSEQTQINQKQKFVMWVAGLRGAMAYALAINSISDYGEPGKIMLSITLIYALITILFIGSALNPILNYCEVTKQAPLNPSNEPDQQERKRCC
jgi:solute carrier family 9 (sodium/hydrogen exchanger), member 8